ncbi:MAG: universal stress protein [Actinomycetota bacterium]
MRTIVVGVDRSFAARVVAGWTAALAAAVGAEVVEAHAFRTPIDVGPDEAARLLAMREADLTERFVEDASRRGVEARLVVRPGDPRQIIGRIATELGADLVALGRSGEGADAEESRIGTVVEHAAHHWSGSLAVVPARRTGPITRIIVGIDGSASSLAALRWAASVAPGLDASVVVVNAPESTGISAASRAAGDLREWSRPVTDSGVEVEYVVSQDLRPFDALTVAIAANGGDLLVLGRRGTGGFPGLASGSVALTALQRSPIPVVLIGGQFP